MATDNTQTIINSLTKAFGRAIEKAWEGKAADTIIDPTANHEACHVARFVYGVPDPMVAAIKQIPGVNGVEVEGMFCHAAPCAFWDRPATTSGIERRELADLMVEVEIVSGGMRASRAVLVQTKMKEGANWGPPITIPASHLQLQQRELYTFLPSFCLELDGLPTAKVVRSTGHLVASCPGLSPYRLEGTGGLEKKNPGGLVYAVIKKGVTRANQRSPWLVEDGRPPYQTTTSNPTISNGVFSIDFGKALASMVVEKVPSIGVRSDGCPGVPRDWTRLIQDLNAFARLKLLQSALSTTMTSAGKIKTRDVVIIPSPGKSVDKALLNRASFILDDGLVMAFTVMCTSQPNAPSRHDSFDTIMATGARRFRGGQKQQNMRNLEAPIPESGFGILKLRIEVEESTFPEFGIPA